MAPPRWPEGVARRADLPPILVGHEVGEDAAFEGRELDFMWAHGSLHVAFLFECARFDSELSIYQNA